MSFVVYSPLPHGAASSPHLRQVCLFLLVGSVLLSSPMVFCELEGEGSKTSFQMYHKTWRGRSMAASSRWSVLGCEQPVCGVM